MKKIGVYGSLREGMHNHDLLGDSKMVEKKTVSIPFKMVSFGAYPALIPDEDRLHPVEFEVYEVDDEIYNDVEMLEGYPQFYDRTRYHDEFEYYFVPDKDKYYAQRFSDEDPIIDWVEYKKHQ